MKRPETVQHGSPKCPRCGGFLETREFVDCWDTKTGEPTDVNEDLYCAKCDLRWCAESGPHSFKEDWNPELHRQRSSTLTKKFSSTLKKQ